MTTFIWILGEGNLEWACGTLESRKSHLWLGTFLHHCRQGQADWLHNTMGCRPILFLCMHYYITLKASDLSKVDFQSRKPPGYPKWMILLMPFDTAMWVATSSMCALVSLFLVLFTSRCTAVQGSIQVPWLLKFHSFCEGSTQHQRWNCMTYSCFVLEVLSMIAKATHSGM